MSGLQRRGELSGRSLTVVLVTCGLSYLFDGYDLVVYGTTLPTLLSEWKVSPAVAGAVGSYALIGMLIGALAVGSVTDLIGRRRVLIGCVTWFSVFTALCAATSSPEAFGALRFLAGLGLGGVLPTLNALTIEYAPARRRNLVYVSMAVGYPVGGLLAATLAIPLIPASGWQVMYLIGATPLVVVLPLAVRALPESLEYLLARGRTDQARALADRLGVTLEPTEAASVSAAGGPKPLFAPGYRAATVLFWMAAFCSLLLVYAMNTWLPQLMRQSGYPLGSALSFLLVFNVGAILGLFLGGPAADRFGQRAVTATGFALAGVSVAVLAFTGSQLALYLLFAVGGYGTVGTQTLLNAFVTGYYPGPARAAGIGWALGVGRLGGILGPFLGGVLLTAGMPLAGIFFVFAAVALAGALLIAAVRPARVPGRVAART